MTTAAVATPGPLSPAVASSFADRPIRVQTYARAVAATPTVWERLRRVLFGAEA
jgi:hypothetical protein